jgi:hypothetical protein
MEIETMTMTEKLLVVRRMIDRGELVVRDSCSDYYDETSAEFNKNKDKVVIRI